jgi:hypothetical protein
MIQTGYGAAKGALNFVVDDYISPFAFSLDECRGNQTFVITPKEMLDEYVRNEDFRAIIDTGRYIYVDGHVCINDPEYVVKQGNKYDECVCIGPMIMMKFVCLTTKPWELKTTVSLNALMVDGTGMCGACRVSVGGKTLFTCVDGPEFDGHQVDFDEAMRRQAMYRTQERTAVENHEHKDCKCYGE